MTYSRWRVCCAVLAAVVLGAVTSYCFSAGENRIGAVSGLGGYPIDLRFDRELNDSQWKGLEVVPLRECPAELEIVPGRSGLDLPLPTAAALFESDAGADEWLRLPRLSFDLATHIRVSSEFAADEFVRHEKLNPRDVIMHRDARCLLQAVLANVSGQLKKLRDAHADLAVREAIAVVHRGGDLPFAMGRRDVVVDDNGDSVEMEFYKVSTGDVLLPRSAGGAYRIAEKLLPGAELARDKRMSLLIELVVGMVEFFETQGILSSEEARRVRRDVLTGLMN